MVTHTLRCHLDLTQQTSAEGGGRSAPSILHELSPIRVDQASRNCCIAAGRYPYLLADIPATRTITHPLSSGAEIKTASDLSHKRVSLAGPQGRLLLRWTAEYTGEFVQPTLSSCLYNFPYDRYVCGLGWTPLFTRPQKSVV